MALFALVHGSEDSGWIWHLVEDELHALGHDTVAPDLPLENPDAGLDDYADAVMQAIGERRDTVVVGHATGAWIASLVAGRVPVAGLVYVAGIVPRAGETAEEWFAATGWLDAVSAAAEADGGLTGSSDPLVTFYHDVPAPLAQEALRRERPAPSKRASTQPWPLDRLPEVPTAYVLCTEDRFFPAAFQRRIVAERLGIPPRSIPSSHTPMLSRPAELAALLANVASSDMLDRP